MESDRAYVPRAAMLERGSAATLAMALGVAAWTVMMVLESYGIGGASLPLAERDALRLGVPGVLVALIALDERAASWRPLRWSAAWCMTVALAVSTAQSVDSGDRLILAVPAVLTAAVAFGRYPAVGIGAVFAISGAFGSLIAFWTFPVEQAIGVVLAGMWVGLILGWTLSTREHAFRIPPSLLLLSSYIVLTLAQLWLDENRSLAIDGFFSSAWFLLAAPLIAVSGWSRETHRRIAQAVIVVAAAVGAYATYRWLLGRPAAEEFQAFGLNQWNYVGGDLRLLGSFPTGQDLGGWTAATIPFCCALAFALRARWRVLALGAAGLCSIALAGSQFRTAVLAVAAGTLAVILLQQFARAFPGLRLGTTLTALLAAGLIGVGAYAIFGSWDDPSHPYDALLPPSRSDPSVDARLYKWEEAIRDIEENPFGHGIGSAIGDTRGAARFQDNVGSLDVDNGFLRIALEQGFAAMLLYAAALLFLLVDLVRTALTSTDRLRAGIAIGAVGTLASFLVLMMSIAFQDGPRGLATWVIVGVGLAHLTTHTGSGSEGG